MRVEKASVVFLTWSDMDGVGERSHTFSSLDQLFGLCAKEPLPGRILLKGTDEAGRRLVLSLSFQSVQTNPEERSGGSTH